MKILFIGDIFPSDEPFYLGFGLKSKFEEHRGKNWKSSIFSVTNESDIVVGNLESPLLDSSLAKKTDFYGNPQFAGFLKDCGVNVLNIANNHILEHGKLGYEETLKALRNSNIDIVGDNNKVLYLQKEDCKIAIAGFCNVDLDRFDNNGCFSVLNEQNVMSALDEMHDKGVDLKIFTFHWGNEYIHRPSMMQRNLAYKLIDAGANIIVGHHSHVIQPYEKYKEGHIFYSLGNFCFNNPFQSRQYSKGMGTCVSFDVKAKEIEDIKTFGIRLSFRHLMNKISSYQFNCYFTKIQNRYNLLKDDMQYSVRYSKELSRRHLIERVLMKLSLVRIFFSITLKEKRMLINNIANYYFKI